MTWTRMRIWLSLTMVIVLARCDRSERPLTEQHDLTHLGGEKGWILTSGVWANPVIPVCWESTPTGQQVERGWVQNAVEISWDANSRVDFTGWDKCASWTDRSVGVRIAVADKGARTLGLGDAVSGVRDGVRLNFTYRKWNSWCAGSESLRERCIRANAVHEFGHVLSFAHEHNRHDRPSTCKAAAQGSNGDVILTPWDSLSIMNYCNEGRMRAGGVLSAGDITSVRQVYGVDSVPPMR